MCPSSTLQRSILCLTLVGCAALSARADDVINILSSADQIVALKQTAKGKPNILAVAGDFGGMEGADETVGAVIDLDPSTKYFNKAQDGANAPGVNTGFAVTPKAGPTVLSGVQFATAGDVPERDPIKITIEGSNQAKALESGASDFDLIYEGPCGLDGAPDRGAWGVAVNFKPSKPYLSYRVLVTAVRGGTTDASPATQYAEVRLLGKHADVKSSGKSAPAKARK